MVFDDVLTDFTDLLASASPLISGETHLDVRGFAVGA